MGVVLSSVSPHCLFAFDRVVFGSQEFEVSCVLEGSVAWLQSVVLNLLLMTRIKGLCKEDRCSSFKIGSVSVQSSCRLASVTLPALSLVKKNFLNTTKTVED